MVKLKFLILFSLLCFMNLKAELVFKPFVANPFEPRIGAAYHFSEQKLRLDIGASFDIAELRFSIPQKLIWELIFLHIQGCVQLEISNSRWKQAIIISE